MTYRNIVRVLTFKKGLAAFNRTAPLRLTEAGFYLLFSVDCLELAGTTALGEYLADFHHTMSQNKIIDLLREMVAVGWVARDKIGRYSVTLSGSNALRDLERRCRETRYDK